jgi:hypothetical protein
MNEIFYYVALDLSLSFTVINTDSEASIKIGKFVVILVIIMLTLNISGILFEQAILAHKYLKRFFIKSSAKIKA